MRFEKYEYLIIKYHIQKRFMISKSENFSSVIVSKVKLGHGFKIVLARSCRLPKLGSVMPFAKFSSVMRCAWSSMLEWLALLLGDGILFKLYDGLD